MNNLTLKKYIRKILSEEAEETGPGYGDLPKGRGSKGKKIQAGEIVLSTGRGGFRKAVKEAGALAEKQPKQLMKNLGIDKGGKDLQGAIDIMKAAISGTDTMGSAYGGLSIETKGDQKAVIIKPGGLDARNGAKFVHHTLIGAKNAGLYSIGVPLQVGVGNGQIVIYTSPQKGSWFN